MRIPRVVAVVAGLLAIALPVPGGHAQPAPSALPCDIPSGTAFAHAAKIAFACSSTRPLKDAQGRREFRVQLGFPTSPPGAQVFPWKAIDPRQDPMGYLEALLQYGIKDNEGVDWRIEDNTTSTWCHAPWFQNSRERLRGMTLERGSRPLELHSLQSSFSRNWAIGFYNDVACHDLGKTWADPAFPKTKGFSFDEGSFGIKLLFTEASSSQVPYLNGSKQWDVAIDDDGGIVPMRLLQVDVAVKDERPGLTTGWVFGTFIYDAYDPGERAVDRLVPVGLTWGNDPSLTAFQYEQRGQVSKESWVNPAVAVKFYHLPRHNLGLFGRLDGPVDNPKASCLACHGQALDWGRGILDDTKEEEAAAKLLPGPPANPFDEKAIKLYFRNLGDKPFVEGTQQLDYSLQVARGIANFREWVLASYPDQATATTDVPAYDFGPPGSPTVLSSPAELAPAPDVLSPERQKAFTR